MGAAFGAGSPAEGRLRAATGGTAATALVVGVFALLDSEAAFLLQLAGAGAVGTLLAWLSERRRASSWPEARYGFLGAVLAAVALLPLAVEDLAYLPVFALVALPIGVAGGAVAGLLAARLPENLLRPVLAVGMVGMLATAGVAVERTLPWLSGSSLVVEGPSTAGSAEQLAVRAAAALRREPDRLSDAAWGRVAGTVVTPREGGRVSIGYDRTADRRRITVLVDGQRACVDVRADTVTSSHGGCGDR